MSIVVSLTEEVSMVDLLHAPLSQHEGFLTGADLLHVPLSQHEGFLTGADFLLHVPLEQQDGFSTSTLIGSIIVAVQVPVEQHGGFSLTTVFRAGILRASCRNVATRDDSGSKRCIKLNFRSVTSKKWS
jgi:hypothetical protein